MCACKRTGDYSLLLYWTRPLLKGVGLVLLLKLHNISWSQAIWQFFAVAFLDAFLEIAMLGEGVLLLLWGIISHETQEDIVGSEVHAHAPFLPPPRACAFS